MIYILDEKTLGFDEMLPMLKDKNIIYINRDKQKKAIKIIKQWIAYTLETRYINGREMTQEEATRAMINNQDYFFRFSLNSLIDNDKFILITN